MKIAHYVVRRRSAKERHINSSVKSTYRQIELGITTAYKFISRFASALSEKIVFDGQGRAVNPSFRNYRIPAFADVPHTEVYFAKTYDAFGPFGAKSMSEAPINPIAPALANALADATGIRFGDLPLAPDRTYRRVYESRPNKGNRINQIK